MCVRCALPPHALPMRGYPRTLLLTVLLGAAFAIAPAGPGHAAPAAPPPPAEQPDAASAARDAARFHQRVEVASRRTATTQVFANPDGSFTAEQAGRPVRGRRGGRAGGAGGPCPPRGGARAGGALAPPPAGGAPPGRRPPPSRPP